MLLSPEAGVWHELGSECLALDPDSREQMAHQIAASLNMSESEKRSRLERDEAQAQSQYARQMVA